ncbi:MAG: alpha/beta fold hydrolase [bacterium]|nr:alpha/beta fold hydrolase [bacterium]
MTEHGDHPPLRRPALAPGLRRLAGGFGIFLIVTSAAAALAPRQRGSIELRPCPIPGSDEEMLCGSLQVFEDRRAMSGRMITLNIVVIPSLSPQPRPEPIFYLTGGPGAAATEDADWLQSSWMRTDWDIVLVDQRGTGRSRPLDCKLPGRSDDLQGYLELAFERRELFRRCKRRLREVANLRLYATATAMDDVDEVRRAMGYGKINVSGGSYGSRAALIYLRRHSQHVRTAVLSAVSPVALLNPLYHAQSAQRAIDLIFEECARDAGCAAAFPAVEQELETVLERLETAPAEVIVEHPDTAEPVTVELARDAFAEGVRLLTYSTPGTRWMPYLVHLAHEGEYAPIAEVAIRRNRSLREFLSMGMLLSVICSDDAPRIDPADIPRLTEGTYLGDVRMRQELALCEFWPSLRLPASYGEPVESDVPVLLLSGNLDPVAPPSWAEEAVRYLSNGYHLVLPGAHGVGGPCTDAISLRFVRRGTMEGVAIDCAADVRLPPFELPD